MTQTLFGKHCLLLNIQLLLRRPSPPPPHPTPVSPATPPSTPPSCGPSEIIRPNTGYPAKLELQRIITVYLDRYLFLNTCAQHKNANMYYNMLYMFEYILHIFLYVGHIRNLFFNLSLILLSLEILHQSTLCNSSEI